ncbi:hypothetical protein ACFVZW_03300 [Streptomyces sp. NPDC059567]|uniref:hypothetical protein n=1 Tax=Streptomyces sp. NPDC059567 TaxID=3346867 RepID=UPI00369CB119
MTRTDLLALDADTLAALTNRGLVKRATKELDAGTGASVSLAADATLRGRFPDGTEVSLPPGAGLDQGSCSCGAPGLCRHLLGLVLAYRRTVEERPAADVPPADASARPWSPGDLDDEALTTAVGRRAVASARRALARGYTARLRHPSAEEPGARAELPTCTVRFPGRDAVGHAVTDASDDMRGEMIALAVWAFRAAVEADPDAPPSQIDVGGRESRSGTGEAALDTAVSLVDELLLDGVAHAGPVLATALRRVRDELTAAALHWPAGALTELIAQLDDHAARGAHYRAEELAFLLTELHARGRASANGAPYASLILGSGERGDTPLRRVRLTALGCRVGGTPAGRTAEVYFAHGGAGIALVLRRHWELAEGRESTGHELASRRIAGSTLGAVARSHLVSERASRTPGRSLTIGTSRVAGTSVTPVGTAWSELPEPLLVRDFAAHARALAGLPPRLVRARVEAESVHVVEVHEVGEIGYDPAEQRLEATVTDARGTTATVLASYNPHSPGGLDALAAALDGGRGEVRHLSAFVRGSGGGLVLDPIAVMTTAGVIVPDLAPPPVGGRLAPTVARRPEDPITGALESALSCLAAAAARGLRHLPEGALTGVEESATRLSRIGLATAAELVRAVPAALRQAGPAAAVGAWVEAQIHLVTASELRSRAL